MHSNTRNIRLYYKFFFVSYTVYFYFLAFILFLKSIFHTEFYILLYYLYFLLSYYKYFLEKGAAME